MDLQLIDETANKDFPVDSRKLHEALCVKTEHSIWINRRLDGYNEDEDFSTVLMESRGRPEKVFMLTIDMAKSIAMMERTDKGKQVRQYFLDIEKEHKKLLSLDEDELLIVLAQKQAEQKKKLRQLELEQREIKKSVSYDNIHKMVQDSLKEETINVFPENCSRLEVIRETVFNGISEAVISKFLNHINHPTKEYKFKMADNVLRSITVFSNIGLADAYNRLRAESIYQKTTNKNIQFTHPVVGNYRVKLEEVTLKQNKIDKSFN